MSKKYTLTCTAEQLTMIGDALEACFRMGIGQPSDALAYARNREGKQAIWHNTHLESEIKKLCELHIGGSFGIGRFPEIDALWEIRAAIRYRLSWDYALANGLTAEEGKRTPKMFGVNYDTPLKYTDQPRVEVNAVK